MHRTNSRTTRVLIIAWLSLFIAACGGGAPGSNVSHNNSPALTPAACLNAEEASLMNQINATRTAAGKPALPSDTRLVQAARQDARQFAVMGIKNFEVGKKYGFGGSSFVGDADAGFPSSAAFWMQAQNTAGTALTDPLTKDTPFAPRQMGVGTLDQSDGLHTYALVIGADPGPAMTSGSCDPAP